MKELEVIPILPSPILGKEVLGSLPDKPALVAPDLSRYEPEFSDITFWEIATVERTVIVEEPDLTNQPIAKEPDSRNGENETKEMLRWVCWFCCQDGKIRQKNLSRARKFGDTLLTTFGHVGSEEPRRSYRCGTIMFRASEEEEKTFNEAWDKEDFKWCCWYAAFGNRGNDNLAIRARNMASARLPGLGQLHQVKRKTVLSFNYTIVKTDGDKKLLNNLIAEVSKKLRSQGAKDHSMSSSDLLRTVPAPAVTKEEFDTLWNERNHRGIGIGETLTVL